MNINELLKKQNISLDLKDFNKFVSDCSNNEIHDIGILTELSRNSLFWYDYLVSLSSILEITYENHLLKYDVTLANNIDETEINLLKSEVKELKKAFSGVKRKVTQAKRLSTDLAFQRDMLFSRFRG